MILCDWCKQEVGSSEAIIARVGTLTIHYHSECSLPLMKWLRENLINPETGVKGTRKVR